MSEEELLKQISRELYKDEWFIEKAIISYKSQQEKTYTFFKDNNKGNLITKYNWCQRPCDTNMSLCRFVINGEVEGYMSESLVSHFNNLKQIDLNEFIHHFVKPLIKENIEQQKEIEVLKEENFDTVYIQAIADYKSKIKEILKIEGNADIEFYLKHLVAENDRLEDIEDRKVQVAADNIEKQRDKYWKDKIRGKIEQLEIVKNTPVNDNNYTYKECIEYGIEELKELLEE